MSVGHGQTLVVHIKLAVRFLMVSSRSETASLAGLKLILESGMVPLAQNESIIVDEATKQMRLYLYYNTYHQLLWRQYRKLRRQLRKQWRYHRTISNEIRTIKASLITYKASTAFLVAALFAASSVEDCDNNSSNCNYYYHSGK